MYSPFRMSRLVTLLSASLGDRWKNLGVRLGGKVRGLRQSALSRPRVFHGAPGLGLWARWSKCSTEAGRGWRWRGYQPLPGPPASLSSSAPTIAWPADNSASLCKTRFQLKGLALLMRDYLGTNTNTKTFCYRWIYSTRSLVSEWTLIAFFYYSPLPCTSYFTGRLKT